MKVIANWTQKGGTGKTTATGIIGAGLAAAGKKTLMIDADPQGNLSNWLAPENANADLSSVIRGIATVAEAVFPVGENLFILPTAEDSSLRDVEFKELHQNQLLFYNKKFQGPIKEAGFEFVIIDNAPTWSVLEKCLAYIVDEIHLIIEPEMFAVMGMGQQIEIIEKACEIVESVGRKISISRTIISQINNSIGVHKEMLAMIQQKYKNTFVVKTDSQIKYMQFEHKTCYDKAYEKSKCREDYEKIVQDIIKGGR